MPQPTELLVLFVLALCGLTIFLLLPTFLELKRPKDKGPRKISETTLKKLVERKGKSAKHLKVLNDDSLESLGKGILVPNVDTIRIAGDIEFPQNVTVRQNLVVEGSLTIGGRCHFLGSIKASGGIKVGDDVVIEGNLVAGGDVTVDRGAKINGSLNAQGAVCLGQDASVGLSLTSGGNVELHKDARVFKNILAGGQIHVLWTPENQGKN